MLSAALILTAVVIGAFLIGVSSPRDMFWLTWIVILAVIAWANNVFVKKRRKGSGSGPFLAD